MRRTIFFMVCALAVATAIGAQTQTSVTNVNPDNDRRQVVPFLDGTYVAFATARRTEPVTNARVTDVTFEADIVPNFVVRQTFFDTLGEEETNRRLKLRDTEYRWATSIVAVPMVKIRMFVNERSSPVRTPSYMPKGTFQGFLFNVKESTVNLFAGQFTVGHHSNGQDGCLFEHQTRASDDRDAPCIPAVPIERSRVPVNRRDGSFSTNYLLFSARYRHITLDPPRQSTEINAQEVEAARKALEQAVTSNDRAAILRTSLDLVAVGTSTDAVLARQAYESLAQAVKEGKPEKILQASEVVAKAVTTAADRTSRSDATVGVDVELNPGNGKFLGGGGIDPEQKARYGATRVTFSAGLARRLSRVCNRAEMKGFGKYIHHAVVSWAASAEGQCLFRQTNWGFFARFYAGQDYYNLGFEDDVRRLQVGMTYSQEGFLRFRAKPVSP